MRKSTDTLSTKNERKFEFKNSVGKIIKSLKMYSENEKGNAAVRRPDLADILDKLREQIDYAGKHSEQIWAHTNAFKDCRQPSPETPQDKQKEPDGVIELLQAEIKRLQTYNNTLRMSAEGLQTIVGL